MKSSKIFSQSRALELLRLATSNPNAEFRAGQIEAIESITEVTNRLVVVQKTGWGKSSVYFIATKLLREAGLGPTLLVSPLLSLMRDQVSAAARIGLVAIRMDSSLPNDDKKLQNQFVNNEVDVLMITEMRLVKPSFQKEVIGAAKMGPSLLVVDEVHCISDWGHDFRPHYRRIESFIRNSPPSLRVLGTTATANDRVIHDVKAVFGDQVAVHRGDLSRNNLILQTIVIDSHAERLAWMATNIANLAGTGIVYVLTIADSELVAKWLKYRGINARPYHSNLSGDERVDVEQKLISNELKVVVATSALGMGFDKPDLAFVIHYQQPASVVAYYQQVGRAGRGVASARGILLTGAGDQEILNYFRESAFPDRATVNELLGQLEEAKDGLSEAQLEPLANLRMKTIKHALLLLSLESPAPVMEREGRWYRTTSPLRQAFWDRVERITRIRIDEQRQMQEYVALKQGHLEYLVAALNGDVSSVKPINALPLDHTVPTELTLEAIKFLQRTSITIEPRVRLPGGGVPKLHLGTTLPKQWQTEQGRALAYWGDAGWGSLVRKSKYELGHFGDELVAASAELIREWNHAPRIEWVTAIPSLRHPTLVKDFAIRLATDLELPFRDAIQIVTAREPQKLQQNSFFQAVNASSAFAVDSEKILSGACLVVDDIVDSRWTFTVAGKLLRAAGSGPVRPFALAMVLGGSNDQ